MPVNVRRFRYGVLTALGIIMMVPMMVQMRRVQAALATIDPASFDPLDPTFGLGEAGAELGVLALFLAGLCVAAGFLYLAVSTGYPKAWRPLRNGSARCARCEAEVVFGLARCPTCEQQLAW
jgi:hypothetical protein